MSRSVFPDAECRPIPSGVAIAGCAHEDVAQLSEKFADLWRDVPMGKNGQKAHHKRGNFEYMDFNNVNKLDPSRPSPTMVSSYQMSGRSALCRWDTPRALTVAECRRVSSFPDEYEFPGAYGSAYARMGDSVPPMLARAVGASLSREVFGAVPEFDPREFDMRVPGQYATMLSAAWAQHLLPKPDTAPTMVSTFAGGGGSSLGYSIAGYRETLAVEWNKHAAACLEANFPGLDIWRADIADLSVAEALDRAGVGEGELDLLDGSPPCQGFSIAGRRVIDDPRNQLFREYVRLLRGMRPKAFVMENVAGMVKGRMRLVFVEILKELKDSGYAVVAKKLNAKWFHVPQSRERMIFIGVRDDLANGMDDDDAHPQPQSGDVTLRQATSGMGDLRGPAIVGRTLRIAKATRQGEQFYLGSERLGLGRRHFAYFRTNWDTTSKTIMSRARAAHPDADTWLSVDAIKRIQSMPDEFRVYGRPHSAWRVVGNAVPPLMARAVGAHVRGLVS